MTSEEIAAVAGVVLSLFFFYVPKVGPWYERLNQADKIKVMGAGIVLVGIAAFLFSCYEVIQVGISCDAYGFKQVVVNIVYALMANQGTYTLFRKLQARPEGEA